QTIKDVEAAKGFEARTNVIGETHLGAPTQLGPSMRKISELFRRRSMIVVISDLYEEPEVIIDDISQLHGRGNDVMVFHLLDPTARELPFTHSRHFLYI